MFFVLFLHSNRPTLTFFSTTFTLSPCLKDNVWRGDSWTGGVNGPNSDRVIVVAAVISNCCSLSQRLYVFEHLLTLTLLTTYVVPSERFVFVYLTRSFQAIQSIQPVLSHNMPDSLVALLPQLLTESFLLTVTWMLMSVFSSAVVMSSSYVNLKSRNMPSYTILLVFEYPCWRT